MAKAHTHGLFVWRGDGRYARSEALRTYASEKVAQRTADAMNARGEHGGMVVVRPLSLFPEHRRTNPRKGTRRRTRRVSRAAKAGVARMLTRAIGGVLMGTVDQVKYHHKSEGPRFHDFGPGVKMYGLPDGSVLIRHPSKRCWDLEANI